MTQPRSQRRRAIFTIAAANYVPYAATLMQSVRRHHPEADRFIVLADAYREFPDIDLAAAVLPCRELGIPLLENMQLWYSITEFNTAIKPFAFRHLFARGYAEACYLDPDIRLFAPMREVFAALARADCVLTPHMTKPLQDGREPSDLAIMKAGVYNLGFLALRDDPEIAAFLAWWSERCAVHCRVDIAANLFTDQRWMDLAPAFIAKHAILRHPGYNVAYWNLAHRRVERRADGRWEVDGLPLVFYHFSGIDVGDPAVFSRHQNRFARDALGAVGALCDEYRALVRAAGWEQCRAIPYGFGRFANGRPIEDAMRRWLLRAIDEERLDPRQPLCLDADYFDRPDETAAARGVAVTRTMYQLWLDREDLRAVFDVCTPDGLAGYYDWFTGGNAEADGCDGRTVAAAMALRDGGAVPLPAAAPLRRRPPWAAVADQAWPGPAAEAGRLFAAEVAFTVENAHLLLPRQAALLWEQRIDLQQHYPLADLESVHEFMAWVLSGALAEGSLDPDLLGGRFVALLNRLSRLSLHYNDVPLSEGMLITRGVAAGRDGLDHWRRFPADRRGRLAHGLWFAFVAPQLFRWPGALAAPLRRYFAEPTEIAWAGFRLNRAALAVWELRADLQRRFPLSDPRSCWGYLYWLVAHGLGELKLELDAFDPRLRPFLVAPSPRYPRLPQVLEMLWEARLDLRQEFAIGSREGRAALLGWAEQHFRASHAGTPLADLYPPAAAAAAPMAAAAPAPVPAPVYRAAVGLTGQWRAATGRGEDIRQAAAALGAVGFRDFLVIDSDRAEVLRPDGTALPAGCRVELDANVVCLNADTAFRDWRVLQRLNVSAGRSIGFWAWELERLPRYWRHAFSFYDAIWTHAEFTRAAVAQEDLRPVRVIPPAVSVPPLHRQPSRAELGLPDDATVFLFMFDFHSFASRKNPEAVVAAFRQAFPRGDERVHLLLKTQCGDADPQAWARLNALCADPRIAIRDLIVGREEVIALLRSADAFVSLHRSEGFGRGPAEAMLLGKPVILTDYSATTDFATADCACPVGYRLRPVAPHEYPGVREDVAVHWAEPDIAMAAAQMRRIHAQPEAARALGRRARAQIERRYGLANAAAALLHALDIPLPNAAGEAEPARNRNLARGRRKHAAAADQPTAASPAVVS
ncbi:MAG: glycosyltransferase [Alphaproteobacteria bacterium]|nr:glycosyltransferase [Alphaproteobacteria bacterium]